MNRTINLQSILAWVYTTKAMESVELVRARVMERVEALNIGPRGRRAFQSPVAPATGWPASVQFNQRSVLEWIDSVKSEKSLPESATPGERQRCRENVRSLGTLYKALAERAAADPNRKKK
jgi:hypothetical protein